MSEFKVFTPEMEYPNYMVDEKAEAIVFAFEMRRFAYEFEWQMENPDDEGWRWVEDAKHLIEDGEVTAHELVREAFQMFWDEGTDFERYFREAVERFQ